MRQKPVFVLSISLILAVALSGCYRPGPGAKTWQASGVDGSGFEPNRTATASPFNADGIGGVAALVIPTPNDPVTLPTLRSEAVQYTVQVGDTLAKIALRYQVTVDDILANNEIVNPNQIEVGLVLAIPPATLDQVASAFKIVPDSELVNSPAAAGFDTAAFVKSWGGYLAGYEEEVDGRMMSGAEIVSRVALEYSVNPRLLLAVLDYHSGWVSQQNPDEKTLIYPMGFYDAWREGLYSQLGFAANLLNEGYYLWKINVISVWTLSDNTVVGANPTINAGTAGVLNLMRYWTDRASWETATTENGVYATYIGFFGSPFAYTFEPMIPDDLSQPTLQLPFELGEVWSYTSGPHGGWDSGSAWAALDFAPPGEALGCTPSSSWVTASAPGEIVYARDGAVIQDLDGDGVWQTGWSILYMHIGSNDRVQVGDWLETGDRIGHPSCEGGFSTGTHLHIARRYNGEWIAADAELPFVMDGWVSSGYGVEYDGYLTKGESIVEAWNGRASFNAIQR
ncbi:MAG: LysM peptidoglycan-binding domain-containing protein [Chloroflexota bacterium]|nr:LysM peptidoglycan-binding domain-containing protein [Chloroflexota bacterium]